MTLTAQALALLADGQPRTCRALAQVGGQSIQRLSAKLGALVRADVLCMFEAHRPGDGRLVQHYLLPPLGAQRERRRRAG